MATILVVDDHSGMRRSLGLILKKGGYQVLEAPDGVAALEIVRKNQLDLVITDLRMAGLSGIDLLRQVHDMHPKLPVVVITAHGTIASAVEAMRLGALDYLTKPFDESDLLQKISGGLLTQQAINRTPVSAQLLNDPPKPAADFISASPEMRAALIKIERIARSDISVLIGGETGTGKTRLARMIHKKSTRSEAPFVSINCANLPETLLESELFGHIKGSFTGATETRIGLLETANSGTVLLDEVDTLSLSTQAKRLQALAEGEVRALGSNKMKPVNVRVICAANRDLQKLVRISEFRADLYFRICGVGLTIPPLRDRPDDMAPLLELFFARFSEKYGRKNFRLSAPAREIVLNYFYPGNIRQLENFVEQMAIFSDETGFVDLDARPEELLFPASGANPDPEPVGLGFLVRSEEERSSLETALRYHTRLEDAARSLGVSRTTLWRKMRQYDLSPRARR
jgi:DNA-binding NtrC family response regulator